MTVYLPRVILGVLTTALVAGCGLTAEDSAREIEPPRGRYSALLSPTPVASEAGAVLEKLYLVKDGMLIAVDRRVSVKPTVAEHLDDLLAGPTTAEREAGLTSALLGTTDGWRISDTEVTVDITVALDETGRNDEVLAFAQVVCTLTSRSDVSGVYFTRDGQRIGVPRADGSLSTGRLTGADYATMVTG